MGHPPARDRARKRVSAWSLWVGSRAQFGLEIGFYGREAVLHRADVVCVETRQRASEVCRLFTPVPQLLRSVRFGDGEPLESPAVKQVIRDGEARLGTNGRLVIRKSGTEPVIRVMAESEEEKLVAAVVDEICAAILAAATSTQDTQPALRPLRSALAQAAE